MRKTSKLANPNRPDGKSIIASRRAATSFRRAGHRILPKSRSVQASSSLLSDQRVRMQ